MSAVIDTLKQIKRMAEAGEHGIADVAASAIASIDSDDLHAAILNIKTSNPFDEHWHSVAKIIAYEHGHRDARHAAAELAANYAAKQAAPVAKVVTYEDGSTDGYKCIEAIGMPGCDMCESLEVGTLIYTASPAASADMEKVAQDRCDIMLKALARIARPMSCGCRPCTGDCRSDEAEEINADAMRDIADEAISEANSHIAVQSDPQPVAEQCVNDDAGERDLRDMFASSAVQGILHAVMTDECHRWMPADFAREAYSISDAMMIERGK